MPKHDLPLPALLSQTLIAFALDFDRDMNRKLKSARVSEYAPTLAMWLNILRFVGKDGVDERRLPALSGVSKPVAHSMVAMLERHGWVTVVPQPADKRAKIVRFTRRGAKLSATWQTILSNVETQWRERFGSANVAQLRKALESVVATLEDNLPHFPMAVPHRGGTPTGL